MKKKLLILTLVLVLLTTVLVACTPANPGAYLDEIAKSGTFSMEMTAKGVYAKCVFAKDFTYISSGLAGMTIDGYFKEEDEVTMFYTKSPTGVWQKLKGGQMFEQLNMTAKGMKEKMSTSKTDKADFNISGKVWTTKDGYTSFEVVKGKLIVKNEGMTMEISNKATIKFPKEAKEAKLNN